MVGLLSTVLGLLLYALLSFRIWQAAVAADLPGRWLAFVPLAGLALVFPLAGASRWWAVSLLVPPVFLIALLWFWFTPARRSGDLGWWFLTLAAVTLTGVSFTVEFGFGRSDLGTLGLNVARLLVTFGLWELLRPDARPGPGAVPQVRTA
jgi:hypothetical protein